MRCTHGPFSRDTRVFRKEVKWWSRYREREEFRLEATLVGTATFLVAQASAPARALQRCHCSRSTPAMASNERLRKPMAADIFTALNRWDGALGSIILQTLTLHLVRVEQ